MKMLTDNLIRPRRTLFSFPRLCAFVAMCLCAYKLNMPNEPNLKTSGPSVTLDMIRTYNDNCPKKRKKNEQKMNKKRAKRAKFHPKNTPSKPNPNPFQTQFKIPNAQSNISGFSANSLYNHTGLQKKFCERI